MSNTNNKSTFSHCEIEAGVHLITGSAYVNISDQFTKAFGGRSPHQMKLHK